MMVRRMLAVFVIGVMVLAGVASGQSLDGPGLQERGDRRLYY